jgi:hypothetical protein
MTSNMQYRAELRLEVLEQRAVPTTGIVFDSSSGIITIEDHSTSATAKVFVKNQEVEVVLRSAGQKTEVARFQEAEVQGIVFHQDSHDHLVNKTDIPTTIVKDSTNDSPSLDKGSSSIDKNTPDSSGQSSSSPDATPNLDPQSQSLDPAPVNSAVFASGHFHLHHHHH